jgi:hypothetical protein
MRMLGTVARGIRLPVVTRGADLIKIVIDCILAASASERGGFTIEDRDIIGVTESLLARSQGNYVNVGDIAADVRAKLPKGDAAVIFPITSRNRFLPLLKGIAAGVSGKLHLLLSYPADEVGNKLVDPMNFYSHSGELSGECFGEEEFLRVFGSYRHPFTGVDYVKLYREVDADKIEIHFSNNPLSALSFSENVIVASVHARSIHKEILEKEGANVIGLDEICSEPVREGAGFNEEYGLLGANFSGGDRVKLFPRGSADFARSLKAEMKARTGKEVEAFVYGDGAFKDPSWGIWELADPVVSPGYTDGLDGMPSEIKFKYIADNAGDKSPEEAVRDAIEAKSGGGGCSEASLGTTPRRLTDLIGSLCDLTSGSGDKGTPVVYVQGYFDSYIDD